MQSFFAALQMTVSHLFAPTPRPLTATLLTLAACGWLCACGSGSQLHSASQTTGEWAGALRDGEFGPLWRAEAVSESSCYAADYDGLILRLGAGGQPVWLQRPSNPELEYAESPALCIGPADSAIVAFSGIGGGPRAALELSRISASGEPVWTSRYLLPAGSLLSLAEAALTRQTYRGQSYCATHLSIDEEPWRSGIGLVSFDAAGELLWDLQLMVPESDAEYGSPVLALDAQGNLYLAASLDEGLLLCSLDSLGQLRWARQLLASEEAAQWLELTDLAVSSGPRPELLLCGHTPAYGVPLADIPEDYYQAGFALSAGLDGRLNWAVVNPADANAISGIAFDASGPVFVSNYVETDRLGDGVSGIMAMRFSPEGRLASAWLRPWTNGQSVFFHLAPAGPGRFFAAMELPLIEPAAGKEAEPLAGIHPWTPYALDFRAASAKLEPIELQVSLIGGTAESREPQFEQLTADFGPAEHSWDHSLALLELPR